MKRMSRITVKCLAREMLQLLLLITLISTTGCSRHFVVVDGGDDTTVKKSELDRLYQDNELLLKALEECRGGVK